MSILYTPPPPPAPATLLENEEGEEVTPAATAALDVEVVTTAEDGDGKREEQGGLASMLRGWQPAPMMAVGKAKASRGGGASASKAVPVEAVLSDARGGKGVQ